MSQHHCSTAYQGRSVNVILGYDRPLGCFFLTVTYAEDDVAVYTYLAERRGAFNKDLDYYRAKLSALEITVPESMFREASLDAKNRDGNRVVEHQSDGQIEAPLASILED